MNERIRCPDFAAILRQVEPDAALLDQVAQCFHGELGRLAARRCRDDALAEDAAQEALVTALEALDSFRGDAPLDHWLKRLVVSACSRLRRGRKNAPAFNRPLDEAREVVDHSALQDASLLLEERVALLRQALEGVSDQNRELLLLHEGQDLSLAELAQRFDLTVDAVKARLKRTRAQLRDRLLHLAEGER